ncbi:hypothetical protein FI667_g12365, partial [Globisporangium splendens]
MQRNRWLGRVANVQQVLFLAAATALALVQLLELSPRVHDEQRHGERREHTASREHRKLARVGGGLARDDGREVARLVADVRPEQRVRHRADSRRHREPQRRHLGDRQRVAFHDIRDARELEEHERLPGRAVEHLRERAERRVLVVQVAADHVLAQASAQQERQQRAARLADQDHDDTTQDPEERPGDGLEQRRRDAHGDRGPEQQHDGERAQHRVRLDPRRQRQQGRLDRQQRERHECHDHHGANQRRLRDRERRAAPRRQVPSRQCGGIAPRGEHGQLHGATGVVRQHVTRDGAHHGSSVV